MTSEDPDKVVARIRDDVPLVAEQLESLAADLRLLSDALSAEQTIAPAVPVTEPPVVAPEGAIPAGGEGEVPAPAHPPEGAGPGEEPRGDTQPGELQLRDEAEAEDPESLDEEEQLPRTGLPRFFAVAGSVVALVGVALVLWLPSDGVVGGQLARTSVGLALAALAAGAAIWQQRIDPGNVGARALLATGITSMVLCVLAVTVRYLDADGRPLVSAGPGLVVTAVVGVAGLWAARTWHSQGVAVVAALASLLAAPAIEAGPAGRPLAAVAVMVPVTLVAGAVQLGRGWVWLLLARTAPTVLYVVWTAASPSIFRWGPAPAPGEAIGIAALLAAVLALGSLALAVLDRSWNWQERVVEAGGLAALSAPLMVIAQTQELRAPTALACLVVGTVFVTATGFGLVGHVPGVVRVTAVPLGVLFLLLGLVTAVDRQFPGYLPWGLAAVTLALAQRSRSRPPLVAGSILGVIGLVWWLPVLPVLFAASFVDDLAGQGVERVVQSLLGVAVAVFGYRAYRTFFPAHRARVLDIAWSSAVVIGAVAVVLAGSLVGSTAGDPVGGFQVAHVLVTLGLGALCIVLVYPQLQGGQERPARARLAIGLALAAVAKLVLFDTQALPAPWRAAVFIAVGVLLIVVGTWYYRQLERARPGSPGHGGQAGGTGR